MGRSGEWAPVVLAAQPGWRALVLTEDETPVACPIVAWLLVREDGSQLEPFLLGPTDPHVVWRPLADKDWRRIVGFMPPGDEMDAAWMEAAEQQAAAYRESGG